MKVVSLLATYNERRYIERAIAHHAEQGVALYVIDNQSTDGTLELVRAHLGRGVIGWEVMPRAGAMDLRAQLVRKQQLHRELGADWYLHQDADQFRYAPNPFRTLVEGFAAAAAAGCNAVDFDVFDFLPTDPSENFEGRDFVAEMRHYYYFRRRPLDQVKAWRNFGQSIDLVSSGGHCVDFPERRIFEPRFIQRHYYALSKPHAIEKYCQRAFAPAEVAQGWHGRRAVVREDELCFPDRRLLKRVRDDNTWDTSDPWTERYLFKADPANDQPLRPAAEAKQPS